MSITPLQVDLTDHAALPGWRDLLAVSNRMTKPPPRFPLALERVAAPRAATAQATRPAPAAPTGHGLDSAGVRARMVARLRADGVRHSAVLAAFGEIPRHLFIDSALVAQAYEDTSLPIGHGQTISKPSVVARMLELLFAGANASERASLGRTLEIGTGCGYQAALLCLLSRSVVSLERLRPLHEKARELIAPVRRDNLRLVYGDGRLGHAPNAPYDRSSRRPAATRFRPRGSSNSRSAAASSRRCRTPSAPGRRSSSSTAPSTDSSGRCTSPCASSL